MLVDELGQCLAELRSDVEKLLLAVPVSLGAANPPNSTGVYMLLVDQKTVYIGEAKGSKGLRDRLLSKHLSGDDNHAIQRAFKESFPDRTHRREHIKNHVFVRWISIQDRARVSSLERLLIWLFKPAWNRT